MSKRENNPRNSDDDPDPKKPKLFGSEFQSERMQKPIPEQRPNSPEPGPSNTSSDPMIREQYHGELVPIYQYIPPFPSDTSSQTSTSVDFAPSTSDTTCSVCMDTTDSQSIVEALGNMDVDMDTTTSESATSTTTERQCFRSRKSRREQ